METGIGFSSMRPVSPPWLKGLPSDGPYPVLYIHHVKDLLRGGGNRPCN